MCPHEDKIIMEYATADYIQTLIDIQLGYIDKAEEEAAAYGIINDVGNQAASQGEVNQIQVDLNRLQQLLSDIQAGEVVLSNATLQSCLLYTSPSPRDGLLSRMPSSA